MSKKKIPAIEINDGHYVEMLDRLHTVNLLIDELLIDHPISTLHPEVKALIQEGADQLINAYQLVGGLDAKQRENLFDKLRNSVTGYQKKYLEKSEKKA